METAINGGPGLKVVKGPAAAKSSPGDDLQYIPRYIWRLSCEIDARLGRHIFSRLYIRLLSPFNYALVGGIGVLINYFVWSFLLWAMPWLPWFFINGLAIIVAWSWNWANSVGPWGWFWGFRKRKGIGEHA